jgi:hypothetical protein
MVKYQDPGSATQPMMLVLLLTSLLLLASLLLRVSLLLFPSVSVPFLSAAVHTTVVSVCGSCEFLPLLPSLMLPVSLLHVAGFSSVADFPNDSCGHVCC